MKPRSVRSHVAMLVIVTPSLAAVSASSAAPMAAEPLPVGSAPPAAGSPAVPTTQEVPPPVPEVDARGTTQTPSSTVPEVAPSTTSTVPPPPAPATSTEAVEQPSTSETEASSTSVSAGSSSVVAPQPEPEPKDRPGVREHDGFFARASSGFAAWHEVLRSDDSDEYGGEIHGRSSGIATTGELTIGGTPWRGVVLAVSLQSTELLASTFRQTDDSVGAPPAELDPGLRTLVTLGPVLIWYPDPKGGLSLGAGLGLAVLTPADAARGNRADGEVYAAGGLSVTLEAGQQFWVAEQWAMGVRGRVLGAIAAGEDSAGVMWGHAVGVTPAVLFDVVYH